jgi:hypothetical protein
MKKLLAALLAGAMIAGITACGSDEGDTGSSGRGSGEPSGNSSDGTPGGSGTDTSPDNSPTTSLEDSRFLAALQPLLGDEAITVTMTMEDGDEAGIWTVYREGDNMRMNAEADADTMSSGQMLLVDGIVYMYDGENDIWWYSEADEDDMSDGFDVSEMFDFDNIEFLGSGMAEFRGEELFYEDIRDEDGDVTRVFFDGADVVGMVVTDSTNVLSIGMEMLFTITSGVPANAFEVPDDAKSFEEYMEFVMEQWSMGADD